jgi:methionine sulfoxide reductase heme-binding subunit
MAQTPTLKRERLRRRLWVHFVPLLALSALAMAVLGELLDQRTVQRLSIASGYAALGMLVLTLAIGPLRVLRGRRVPLSLDLRRDAGICTAILGLAHVVLGLQVHFGGAIWRYFIPVRLDKGIAANWTGLAATGLLLVLLALSSDRSMQLLGGSRWKSLQRLAYVLFGLVAVHTVLYQFVEQRAAPLTTAGAALLGVTLALQLAGARRRARRPLPRPRPG